MVSPVSMFDKVDLDNCASFRFASLVNDFPVLAMKVSPLDLKLSRSKSFGILETIK